MSCFCFQLIHILFGIDDPTINSTEKREGENSTEKSERAEKRQEEKVLKKRKDKRATAERKRARKEKPANNS